MSQNSTHTVLVLDGDQRSALAIVRSLGRKGLHVVVGGEQRRTLAGCSRYCAEQVLYPSPAREPERFLDVVADQIGRLGVDVLLPVTEITTSLVLENQDRLGDVRVPFGDADKFARLSDKIQLMELASRIGVPVPRSAAVRDAADAGRLAEAIGYPLVIKPARSRILEDGRWTGTSVAYAHNPAELEAIVGSTLYLQRHPFLLQEYVEGEGQGIFTLYHRGNPVVFFAHRRLREKPPSGGVSVLSESCEPSPALVESSRKILDHVGWDGVAMVEFKVRRTDGVPFLMEVNARFWGSLQLAVFAGVNFPYLQYQCCVGETPSHPGTYRVGVRNRWLLGDLDHLYLRLKQPSGSCTSGLSVTATVMEFMKFFQHGTRYEINRFEDMRPFWFELARYVGWNGTGR